MLRAVLKWVGYSSFGFVLLGTAITFHPDSQQQFAFLMAGLIVTGSLAIFAAMKAR